MLVEEMEVPDIGAHAQETGIHEKNRPICLDGAE